MIEYAWLIPLLPVAAFVLIIAFGRKLPGEGAYVAIAAMLASLVMSFGIAAKWFLLGGSARARRAVQRDRAVDAGWAGPR